MAKRKTTSSEFRMSHADMAKATAPVAKADEVSHPGHYNWHPTGVEAVDIVEHMTYNIGAAVAYLWRAGRKGTNADAIKDLRKAAWHASREAERLEKEG